MGAIRQTLISKDIISFKKTLNAYIYSIIKMNSNYYNGVSEITYPKIAGLSNISEGIIKTHLSEKDEKGKFVFKDNLQKTVDIHPPKTGISVHFSCSLP